MGEIVHSNVQVTRLHYGHNVADGVEGREVTMVAKELFGQDLTVGGAQPVHACRKERGAFCLALSGGVRLDLTPVHYVLDLRVP